MNRLQKKCFIASAGLHLLLALVLLTGPAFLSSNSKPDNLPLLDFVPVKTVDALMSGGGNPKAQPPPPTPQPQPPAPQPAKPPPSAEPAVKTEPVKPVKIEEETLDTGKEHKRKINVNTTLVKRNPNTTSDAKSRAETEARREAAAAINRAARGIEGGLSGSTEIELKGPGGGGVPYANWIQAVKSVYDRAWILPTGTVSDSGIATATVTIARDGTVISSEIVRRSGNAAVDDSVRTTLDRVRYAAPLPDDAKEDQRTISIKFDVNAKLLG